MKRILISLLLPVAKVANQLSGWTRLWSHVCLAARLQHRLDPTVVVLGTPEVHGTRNIRLGRHLYLYRELYFETQEQGAIVIGDDVVISRGVHIVSFDRIEIGCGSMIGEYLSIRDANHRLGGDESPRSSGHLVAPVSIGRNVWIGRGVSVLAGVHIGEGAVVGANAVVTADVPAGAVVAGAPARPLVRRVRV